MPDTSRSFLIRVALAFVVVVAGNVAFNVVMNVYDIFPTPTWAGLNDNKLGIDRHSRIAKAYAVARQQPEAIILGTSRAESTFDPTHPYFSGLRGYNLALPGAAVYEEYRYLQHATAGGQLKRAVLALDFQQFLEARQQISDDFSEDRLALDAAGRPQAPPLKDIVSLLASGSAFHESWWSFQRRRQPSIYRADGYRSDSNDIAAMLDKPGGQKEEFLAVEKRYLQMFRGKATALANTAALERSPLADVERILSWSEEHGIDIVIVIPPVHARQLALLRDAGLWESFESWKRELSELSSRHQHGERCPLVDFANVNAISSEVVPPAASKLAMRYWRESSHATRAAGTAMLDVLQAGETGMPDRLAYGDCLRPQTIEASLGGQRRRLAGWGESHPDDLAEIHSLSQQTP